MQSPASAKNATLSRRTLSAPLLAALYYFSVSGGPIGSESIVSMLGPFVGLTCLLLYPLVYSLPVSLTTAELSSAYSKSGGYVHWCYNAFGPRTAFLCGALSYLSGIADAAIYPGLFVSYMTSAFGESADIGTIVASKVIFICFWFIVVFSGVKVVGRAAFIIGGMVLSPFIIFVFVGMPQVEPKRWLEGIPLNSLSQTNRTNITSLGSKRVPSLTWHDYCTFASVLYWNFSGGDQLSTFAGEVKEPRRTYPRAALWGVAIVSLNYLLPLLVVSGVLKPGQQLDNFTVGGFPQVAEVVGGLWLKWMVLAASWLGCCALFFAEICEDAFLLLGMSELKLAPLFCSSRNPVRHTPTYALLSGAILVTVFSLVGSFIQIVALDNAFNCVSILLEIAAAIWLRFERPDLERPFRVPVSDWYLIAVLLIPIVLTIVVGVSSLASDKTGNVSIIFGGLIVLLLLLHEFVLCQRRVAFTGEGRMPESRICYKRIENRFAENSYGAALLVEEEEAS